nr:unnamed protein product [Callosobruchus chinensis]
MENSVLNSEFYPINEELGFMILTRVGRPMENFIIFMSC